MVQIQSGKLTEAIDLLRSRKALSPESYLVNLYLGEALSRKGVPPNTKEDSEADQALRYAERANPGSAAPHALRGKLLFARGDLPNAAHEFEQALQLNPRDSAPAYQLSLIYRKQGDNDKADAMLNLFQKNKQADKNEALDSNLLDVLRDSVR
jgi:tetratricopeptide (TPR) repeat protein